MGVQHPNNVFTKLIPKEKGDNKEVGEFERGAEIVEKSCAVPLRQILKNAGADEVAIYKIAEQLAQIQKEKMEKTGAYDLAIGYDAATGTIANMISSGIVDPTKVVRSTLENAASAASMFLTTEVVVAEKPEKEDKGGTPQMPPMPGGY